MKLSLSKRYFALAELISTLKNPLLKKFEKWYSHMGEKLTGIEKM